MALTSISTSSLSSQPVPPTPSATSAALSGMMMQQTVVNQLAQRTRRIAPIAKPPGIDPLEIARERETRIKAAIVRRIDILSSLIDQQKRPPPPPLPLPPPPPPPSTAVPEVPLTTQAPAQTAAKPVETTVPEAAAATATTNSTTSTSTPISTTAAAGTPTAADSNNSAADSAQPTNAEASVQSEQKPVSASETATTTTTTSNTSTTTAVTTTSSASSSATSSASSSATLALTLTTTTAPKPIAPPPPIPKSTLIKAEIEVRALRLLEFQKYVRMQVLSTIRRDTTLETALLPQAYKRPKRFTLKEARAQEKLEARMRAEEERRKQRLHQAFLTAVVQHAKDFKVAVAVALLVNSKDLDSYIHFTSLHLFSIPRQEFHKGVQGKISKLNKAVIGRHANTGREMKREQERLERERMRRYVRIRVVVT